MRTSMFFGGDAGAVLVVAEIADMGGSGRITVTAEWGCAGGGPQPSAFCVWPTLADASSRVAVDGS